MSRDTTMSRLVRIQTAPTLDELYALIPQPDGCDGSCHQSCGPLGFSAQEGERIRAAGGSIPNLAAGEMPNGIDCPALTTENRCSIYDARPASCRLWGSSAVMPCMAPTCTTRHPLTDDESRAVLRRTEALSDEQAARNVARQIAQS